jgi:hypothetical protein
MANKRLLMAVSATILGSLFVIGCNSTTELTSGHQTTLVSGNWAFSSAASPTTPRPLTLNVGFANVSKQSLTAIAHLSGASCVSSTTGISFSGSIDANNNLVLTSAPFNGNTLSVKGQLAADGKSISAANWSFAGGNCASLGSGTVSAMAYAQINGTYTGTFVDADSNQLAVSATLTQTTQPDENGQFHLSGSATFPNNPCFTASVVTDSQVTGSSLSTTYTEGGASITATGTFNSDATELTVTNWQVSGGLCDGDSGTGLLTEPE